ncbi:uncharacterized protein BDV14DRAFT_132900 [Aspergillus stella-maris]|uniref:uncharacterized protein n=1 Tax=Aspergillus stella-maris TaxID=1810926 RepID=UPI003CCDFE31
MSSKQTNAFSPAGTQAKQAAQTKTPRNSTDGWSVEEMLETGMDKDGNIVSDDYSWIDGAQLNKGKHGNQQADEVAAATEDFD